MTTPRPRTIADEIWLRIALKRRKARGQAAALAQETRKRKDPTPDAQS